VVEPDSVDSAKVADGSLRLADLAVVTGTAQVDAPPLARLGTSSCTSIHIAAPGALPGDQVVLNPGAGENPDPRVVVGATVVDTADNVTVRACNMSGTNNLDAEPAAYVYSVFRL
jgi:hypothetical protein